MALITVEGIVSEIIHSVSMYCSKPALPNEMVFYLIETMHNSPYEIRWMVIVPQEFNLLKDSRIVEGNKIVVVGDLRLGLEKMIRLKGFDNVKSYSKDSLLTEKKVSIIFHDGHYMEAISPRDQDWEKHIIIYNRLLIFCLRWRVIYDYSIKELAEKIYTNEKDLVDCLLVLKNKDLITINY